MISFTQIPTQNTPLGGKAVYAFETDPEATIDIRIAVTDDDQLLGAKRFVSVTQARFDAAPLLRCAVRFRPTAGGTGFKDPAGRTVTASVSAAASTAGAETAAAFAAAPGSAAPAIRTENRSAAVSAETKLPVVAPPRTFLPCAGPIRAPALPTALPRERLIAPGECDELTLLHDGPLTVTVTDGEATETAAVYRSEAGGLLVFRLDTRDFPEAGRLTVDAGACGKVVYTLLPEPQGSRRLAWRTAAGSLEHYTFPVERTVTLRAAKRRFRSPEGTGSRTAETQTVTALESAFENRAVLEALAELLPSPQVWLAEADVYTPVDVVSEEAVVHRYGRLGSLSIEIRPACEPRLPWN